MKQEACNCNWNDFRDAHIWIVSGPKQKKSSSVVAEIGPRLPVGSWNGKSLKALVSAAKKARKPLPHVRVRGWLMLDTHHMNEAKKDRATF